MRKAIFMEIIFPIKKTPTTKMCRPHDRTMTELKLAEACESCTDRRPPAPAKTNLNCCIELGKPSKDDIKCTLQADDGNVEIGRLRE